MEAVFGESVTKKECVSVVIPAYNAARYLDNCLQSVLHQTYPNIEIVLVDDGSIDETGTIADQYAAKYPDELKVIHTENQGVTNARFTGIQVSGGEWIGFVDADDEIEPDMYERLYKNAVEYGADISHCGYKTIVNDGERVHEFGNTGRFIKQYGQEAVGDLLDGVFEPTLCTKLFRRELIESFFQNVRMDVSIKYNEDFLMNYYLFQKAQLCVLDDFCGYHYLARIDSATRNRFQARKVLDPVSVSETILSEIEKATGDPALQQKLLDKARRHFLKTCMNAYAVLHDMKEYKEECIQLREGLKSNREKWYLLRKNDQIKLKMLMISPDAFSLLYRVYERYLQKKQYE